MTVWTSGFKPTELEIRFSNKMLPLLTYIQSKCDNNEFSILFKGEWVANKGWVVSDDYIIPKQVVAGTSVDYEEDISALRENGYNTVFHSHPFSSGKTSFSTADETTINAHFPCSILLNKKEVVKAVINIKVNGVFLQLKCEKFIEEKQDFDLDLSNIQEKTYTAPVGNIYSYHGYNHHNHKKEEKKEEEKEETKEKLLTQKEIGELFEEAMGKCTKCPNDDMEECDNCDTTKVIQKIRQQRLQIGFKPKKSDLEIAYEKCDACTSYDCHTGCENMMSIFNHQEVC